MTAETPDKKEIYRYLGYRSELPDERVVRKVDAAVEKLMPRLRPKSVYLEFPLEFCVNEEAPALSFAGLTVKSKALWNHLSGCTSVILFALTVGPEPDRLIRRSEVDRISDAVIYQAVSAAAVESEADRLNEELIRSYGERGFSLKTRFSPGYGDFDLAFQKDFIRILNTPKAIGLTLTEGLLMIPTKSITAVIGVYRKESMNGSETSNENPT